MTTALPENESDAALLTRFRRGDARAFDTLVVRHHGLVFAVAYARLQDADAAEDLAQEVFVRAFLLHEKLRDGDRFAPWVSTMARNLATDWQRRGDTRSRLIPLIPMEDDQMKQVPDREVMKPDEVAERNEQRRLADEAISALPPAQRELVLLHFTEGMSRSDIARHLGVHPSTVGRQLDAAIAAMRTNVESSLKHSAPALRPRTLATARTVALVAAAMALAPEAKAAIAHTAAQSLAAVAAEQLGEATILSLLKAKLNLLIGGIAALGTGKIAVAVVAVAFTVAGVHFAHQEPEPTQSAIVALAGPGETPQIAATMSLRMGDTVTVKMKPGKIYELYVPEATGELLPSYARFTAEGELRSSRNFNGEIVHNQTSFAAGQELVELHSSIDPGYLGCTIFHRQPDGLELTMWLEKREDILPELARITSGYLEGRINTRQYREAYVVELRRLSIGPRGDNNRRLFQEALLTQLAPPQSMPPTLEPFAKGSK